MNHDEYNESNWETIDSLLHTIALIREAAGVNEKPMLSELPDAIRKLRRERDEARRIACENEAAYNGMMYDNPKYSDPIAVMREHGWDCFKE